jgi:hypothetical protein
MVIIIDEMLSIVDDSRFLKLYLSRSIFNSSQQENRDSYKHVHMQKHGRKKPRPTKK